MSDPEELARQKERRRQLIERLNEKEEFFGLANSARREQMGEELEIERERNYSRRGFGQIYDGGGGDFGAAADGGGEA